MITTNRGYTKGKVYEMRIIGLVVIIAVILVPGIVHASESDNLDKLLQVYSEISDSNEQIESEISVDNLDITENTTKDKKDGSVTKKIVSFLLVNLGMFFVYRAVKKEDFDIKLLLIMSAVCFVLAFILR